MIKLRRPTDKIGGCVWLPRFIDKCRLYQAASLPADYKLSFCNPQGIDGVFLSHFSLAKEEFLRVVSETDGDPGVAAWLEVQGMLTPGRVTAWNELAPTIGQPGQPGEKGFAWARRHFYASCTDPRVNSAFTAIAW